MAFCFNEKILEKLPKSAVWFDLELYFFFKCFWADIRLYHSLTSEQNFEQNIYLKKVILVEQASVIKLKERSSYQNGAAKTRIFPVK